MVRAVWTYVLIAAAGVLAALLADSHGRIAIDWLGTHVEAPFTLVLALVAGLILLAILASKALDWLAHTPGLLGARFLRARRSRARSLLTRGLAAVAAGDAVGAKEALGDLKAATVEPDLHLLLKAEAAQLSGDLAAARESFEAMLERPQLKFLGYRGLAMIERRLGNLDAAGEAVERAAELRSGVPWIEMSRFEVAVDRGAWGEARAALDRLEKAGRFDAKEAAHRRAVLLTAEARDKRAADEPREALRLAEEAQERDPAFTPATIELASALRDLGRTARAEQTIQKAWAQSPHPALAAIYASLRPNESLEKRADRFASLVEANRDHPESRHHFAELAFARGKLLAARDALRPLLEPLASSDIGVLMADIERADGQPEKAEAWLRKAADAPRDPAWACAVCFAATRIWEARCPTCNSFDSLAWREPPAAGSVRRRVIVDGIAEEGAEPEPGLLQRLFGAPTTPPKDAPAGPPLQPEPKAEPAPAPAALPALPAPVAPVGPPRPSPPAEPVIFVPPKAPDDPGPLPDEAGGDPPRAW